MSEGVNETAVSSVDSSTAVASSVETTLEECSKESRSSSGQESSGASSSPLDDESPPPATTKTTKAHAVRKHRKYVTTGRTFHLIDGKKIRSALTHKIRPSRNRRVSFPTDDSELVTGYLEPANPWEHAENVNVAGLISSYKESCRRHGTEPMENLIAQLEKLDISDDERCPELNLKGECLEPHRCEPLEELLKRVQFEKIDVESSSLDDESATILFDMLEYYQSARHLNMSSNRNIGSRGWQACAQMIKKTTCLEQLEARDITLTQQHMNILKRPLQLVSHLHVLKLENCGLAGPAFVILVSALKMNTGLKELYLADNGFEKEDAIQLGALLRVNNHLQLLDISNNHIKDEGVRDLMDGLIAQSGQRRNGKGLSILVLWNNDLTRSSSTYISEAIVQCESLETLNIGKNPVGNEMLELSQEAIITSQTLLQLGMQSTNISCKGALLLAGIIEKNRSLQRIDLRDNNIQMEGLAGISFAMKRNPCITQLDLDVTPWSTKQATMDQYVDLVSEIKALCARNDEMTSTDESTEESGSPQHRSRLSSVSSRKISLTCQTLPRSPPSITPNSINDIATRSMLEPKRTSGGRLRSPAPSPIPSPVASPIPSPSRNRFVVSRVCENSLSSTNSSASSSPITPSSLGSSPTCFFPPTSSVVSSRFRVTVVEANHDSTPSKSVVTPANANVTIGFDYKVDAVDGSLDSDESDSVFRADSDDKPPNDSATAVDTTTRDDGLREATSIVKTVPESFERPRTVIETKKENQETESSTVNCEEIENNQVPVKNEEDDETFEQTKSRDIAVPEVASDVTEFVVERSESVETKVDAPVRDNESLRNEIIPLYDEKIPEQQQQRPATSLERLLGLFQHPGSLFSSSCNVEKTEIKNPIQDSVNSMIALGNKFQQYLRDGRAPIVKSTTEETSSHPVLQRSVSDASRSVVKADPVKSFSIQQLSSIQAPCSRDSEFPENSKDGGTELKISKTEEIAQVPEARDIPTLPEIIMESREPVSDDANREKFLSNQETIVGHDLKEIPSKLNDIPENSILETNLEISSSRDEPVVGGYRENNRLERICDSSSSTTDSINDPSFKNSSHCKLTCDITSGGENVHIVGSTGDVHNFFTTEPNVRIARPETPESRRKSLDSSETKEQSFSVEIIDTILVMDEAARELETIEEFLPIEATASPSIISEQLTTRQVENGISAVTENSIKIEKSNEDISMIENMENEEISGSFVTSTLTNFKSELAITRVAVKSSEFVATSMEQVSRSLSEDSGYSGKLSVDEPRNGSLNDSEMSPGNETIDRILSESSILESSLEMESVRSNEEESLKIEESPFVDSRIVSGLDSFVDNNEAKIDSVDVLSSESSEDLIFKITDIDAPTIPKETTRAIVTEIRICDDEAASIVDCCYYETGQSSSGNLYIERSRNAHRNSQDSGIEETTTSISEENGLDVSSNQTENFQESLDSGIDSECSSVCVRLDATNEAHRERSRETERLQNPVVAIIDDIDVILGTRNIMEDDATLSRLEDEKKLSVKQIPEVVASLQDGT